MSRVGWKSHAAYMLFLCIALAMAVLCACDDSTAADADELRASLQKSSSSKAKSSSSKELYPDTFKPNDKEYPYANIPRIVIYTENLQKIKDRETEIPAKLQIWGKKEAESEILDLTIRGRGNSSWEMPKKSYKIEFAKKQSMLGMPKDKDWALIANYADKTLMRNFIAYRLSAALGAYYAPRCEFAELYLNGEYLGVYLLTETIKIGKNRVNIPENGDSYIVEVDHKYKKEEVVFFTYRDSLPMRIDSPSNECSGKCVRVLSEYIDEFERFLRSMNANTSGIEKWLSLSDYIKHFWVQEFSKNPDAGFYTSVFFTWCVDDVIKMGPVWDFDIAYGNHQKNYVKKTMDWYTIGSGWNMYLFRNRSFLDEVNAFWKDKSKIFKSMIDSVGVYRNYLNKSAQNNFKRWYLDEVKSYFDIGGYATFDDAVDALVLWLRERFMWVDNEILTAGMKQL